MRCQYPLMLGCLFLLAALTTDSNAQTVHGHVRFSQDGTGIPAALVSLVDDSGRAVKRVLTNREGRFLLHGASGRFSVQAERIGLTTKTEGPFELRDGVVFQVDVTLDAAVISLPRLSVEVEEGTCDTGRENAAAVLRVWQEVEKTLRVVAWGEETAEVRYRVDVRRTEWSRGLDRIQAERVVTREGKGTEPFKAVSHQVLIDSGFVRGPEGARNFLAPDAAYLLSGSFLETHCLVWEGSNDETISLAFRPRPGRDLPDISGRILIDTPSYALREVRFTYENLRFLSEGAKATGGTGFLQLPSGEWVVDDWWIRMPRQGQRIEGRRRPKIVHQVIGYREVGGRLTGVWPENSVEERAEAGTIHPTGSLSGQVINGLTGEGLAGGKVFVSGTTRQDTTDREGRFFISDVPIGPQVVAVSHPQFDELRVWARTEEVVVTPDLDVEIAFKTPDWRDLKTQFCQGVRDYEDGVLILGLFADPPTHGNDRSIVGSWEGRMGLILFSRTPYKPRAPFALCGLPKDRSVWFRYESEIDTIPLGMIESPKDQLVRWRAVEIVRP